MRRRAGFGKGLFDLVARGRGVAFEEFSSFDHHAVLAEAAERSLLGDPGFLNGVKDVCSGGFRETLLLCPTSRQAFESSHLFIFGRRQRWDAGPDLFAVQQHRAGPALRKTATKLRTSQFEVVAQDVE